MDKMKQLIVKAVGWGASSSLIAVVLTFQLFIKEEMPNYVKFGVPALIALLIIFAVCYKYLRGFITRKLTAMETVKQLGYTVSPILSILNDCVVTVPIALIAAVFLLIGMWSHSIGLILLECSGILQFGFISNIIARIGANNYIHQKEIEKAEANNKAIAQEVKKIIATEEVDNG